MSRASCLVLGLALAIGTGTTPAVADTNAGYQLWNEGDFYGAVAQWRPAAIAGDPTAQYNLARAYQLGRGVPVDLKMAETWFGKAATQGHLPSRDNYGLVLFQNGDRTSAMPYIEEASDRGDSRAQYVLGTALFNGDTVKKDWVRAYALMTRASAAGIGAASSSLAQMDKYVPVDQRQRGLTLARKLESAASKPQVTAGLVGDAVPLRSAVSAEDLPPSDAGASPKPTANPASKPTRPPAKTTPVSAAPTKPSPVKVAFAPRSSPAVKASAPAKPLVPNAAPSGNWKVQLAAFGDAGKAKGLWSSLHSRIDALGPYHALVVKAGAMTRLQAGPLISKAAAERLCASVKAASQPCIPVAP